MGFRFQNSLQSKIDQTFKISKSVFISNFPDDCSSRDLWKNLKTIWIGRFHLSANPARFERPKATIPHKEMSAPSGIASGLKQPIAQHQGGPKGTK
ncbi:hypothetical protein Tco_0100065, partial [Tanacetum coccineum]